MVAVRTARVLPCLAVVLLLALAPRPASANQVMSFPVGSLIIPMDVDYQDAGMLKAFGLLDKLLRMGITVNWAITPNKVSTNAAMGRFTPDFTASATDFKTNAVI